MPRILKARRSGAPGGRASSLEAYTGQRVSKDREGKRGVRRLFARDPRKGAFVNFGTDKDILDFRNDPKIPNPNPGSSPRILNGSTAARSAVTKLKAGAQHIRNRSLNRSIKRR